MSDYTAFVAEGRCGCCGRSAPWWTPQRIVEAAQAWHRTHGQAPKSSEWRQAGTGTPSSQTVTEVFGSFRNLYRAAGLEMPPRTNNTSAGWTRDLVVAAVYRWVFDHGRLPRAHEWMTATDDTPAAVTVRRLFGGWNAAMVAAGYEPTHARRSARGYRAVMAGVTKAAA